MSSYNQNRDQIVHRLSHDANLHGYQEASIANSLVARKMEGGDVALSHEELRNYEQYLDDYNYCRKERLKRNAMDKYNLIMQSVRNKSKDQFPYEVDDDEPGEARDKMVICDIERSPAISSASSDTKLSHDFLTCYKKILKRHGRRLRGNQYRP